ncbi:MAG: T9SS type A sorting domain-containing protein, partial [Paludibacteraceae bacterium]|nr:T9SS type A sorting domain-containing protein [Paludibacteraceae bacterium]
ASYTFRFSENFSYGTTSFGGKLPGLSGGDNCSGGSSCDGTNGFSARFMWRDGGKIVLYLYHMDKPSTYGEDVDLVYPNGDIVYAKKGEWYHIAERVKINSDGNTYDGEVQVWVNGVEVLHKTGLRFTSNGDVVDNFYISTFHGGSNDDWCPTDTCHIWFDDIIIGNTYDDVKFSDCKKPNAGPNRNLCSTNEVKVESDLVSPSFTYSWIKDRKVISTESAAILSEVGEYQLVVDSMGCSKRDTLNLSNKIEPILPEELHICSQSFATIDPQLSADGLKFEWSRNGERLSSTDAQLKVKDAGSYELNISSPNCESVSKTIEVSSGLLSVEDVTADAGENVELSVIDSGNYGWYSSATGGEILSEGMTYSTTMPSSPTYLYVKDLEAYNGLVGKKQITKNTYTFPTSESSSRWLLFTAERPFTIDSVSVYPHTLPCDIVIRIVYDETEEVLFSQEYKGLQSGENRLALNAQVKNAGKYRMDLVGSTGILKQSHTDEDISYPYTIDGVISIDGTNVAWMNKVGGRYLALYNWRISAGNICARTPVLLSPSQSTQISAHKVNKIDVYPTFTDGDLFIEGLSGESKITLYNSKGKKMIVRKQKSDKAYFSLANFANGEYLLQIEMNEVKTYKILKY